MKLCRYDEDRLGVVVGNMVHDVTAAQEEIRKGARYDMKGDAVIAALPTWRNSLMSLGSSRRHTPGTTSTWPRLSAHVASRCQGPAW